LIAYCLMPNHVHLLAVPHKKDALARSLKDIHGRFASSWNATYHSSGHVWQGRYYSCPLDESRFYALDLTLARPGRA
jgi:putative transposase